MTQERAGPRLLTISEAAAMLGISPNTLRRWADQGVVKTIKLPSGYRRFELTEIERKRREMGFSEGQENRQ